jgi:NAD-dependent dihydropyrimidine dehydrogenase PreA subunit
MIEPAWFPAIDAELCVGDLNCVQFCGRDVLAVDPETLKVDVRNPQNCVALCDACAQICPQNAIELPDKRRFRASLAEMGDGQRVSDLR